MKVVTQSFSKLSMLRQSWDSQHIQKLGTWLTSLNRSIECTLKFSYFLAASIVSKSLTTRLFQFWSKSMIRVLYGHINYTKLYQVILVCLKYCSIIFWGWAWKPNRAYRHYLSLRRGSIWRKFAFSGRWPVTPDFIIFELRPKNAGYSGFNNLIN